MIQIVYSVNILPLTIAYVTLSSITRSTEFCVDDSIFSIWEVQMTASLRTHTMTTCSLTKHQQRVVKSGVCAGSHD